MQSLIGTGSNDEDTLGEGFEIPNKVNHTLEPQIGKKLGAGGAVDSPEMQDMKEEMVSLRHEIGRLRRVVQPLMAINELSLNRKRIADSGEFSHGSQNLLATSEEEKERLMEKLNPQLVLNNLAEFVNCQELPNKRVTMIERRFCTLDMFNKFKQQVANDEERKSAQQDITKQIRQVFSKMQDMDANQLNLENDIGNIRTEVRNKAGSGKVDQLEMTLVDFATKIDFQKILNKLESYTTLESFNKSRIKQEGAEQTMKQKMDTFVSKNHLKNEIGTLKDHIADVNKSNSQKRDCLKDKKEMEKQFEKLQKELLDLRDDHRNSKERIRNLEVLIGEKVHNNELAEVKEYMALLPTKDEVTGLRNYMKQNIDKFASDNNAFEKDFNAHLAIIRRYDEVLSEKASKHSVYLLESKQNEQNRPVMKDLDDRILNNLKLIKEGKEQFTEFKELMTAEVYTAVKRSVIQEIKQYEYEKKKSQPHVMGINAILNEGENGFFKVLSLKADQNDLEKLHEIKTNKVDTENMMDLIIEMNRLVQHIIVLLNETLKINLIKANDTRLAKENRSHELIIQVHALSQWALKFDVKKRLEDEMLLQGSTTAHTNSIDSSNVNPQHQKTKMALKNAHHALKKSIATAKDSAQRRYRSPCRQKDRISNTRNLRLNNELFDFGPAEQPRGYSVSNANSSNVMTNRTLFTGGRQRGGSKQGMGADQVVSSFDKGINRDQRGGVSYMHQIPPSGAPSLKGASMHFQKTSYGGGFTFASSRDGSGENGNRRESYQLNAAGGVAMSSSLQSAMNSSSHANRKALIESSHSAQRTIGAMGGVKSPHGLIPQSNGPIRVNTANTNVMSNRRKQMKNKVMLEMQSLGAVSPRHANDRPSHSDHDDNPMMESVEVDLNMKPMGFPEHANMNSSQIFDHPLAQGGHKRSN